MKTSKNIISLGLIFIFGIIAFESNAQDMQDHFDQFKRDASKWEGYTMVKHHVLDEFWKVVSDTLNKNQSDLVSAQNQINSLNSRIDTLTTTLKAINQKLAYSESVNATIGFLGIQINKILYNIVLWAIIAGLCGTIAVLYMMYTSSNKVTRSTKKDYSQLANEFSEYKEKATKKQISLKRELQTAINTLEDNRIKISQKLGYNKDSSRIS
ncbi:MAG: hypothetical protein ACFHWX_08745 [Bacteroidota bacterium]